MHVIFASVFATNGHFTHKTENVCNRWILLVYHVWRRPTWIEFYWITYGWGSGHTWRHNTLEGLWPHYMVLEGCWDGLWTLSFELPRFHGYGPWLVCEVTLSLVCECVVFTYSPQWFSWYINYDLEVPVVLQIYNKCFGAFMKCQEIGVAHTNEPIIELESLEEGVYHWRGESYACLFTLHLRFLLESSNFVRDLQHLNGELMGPCGTTTTDSMLIKTLTYLMEFA